MKVMICEIQKGGEEMIKKILVACLLLTLIGCQTSTEEVEEKDGHSKQEQDELKESNEEVSERKEITGKLTNSDLYNLNVYLSDLSNSRFETYNKENLDHDQLLELGFWLYVYEGMDKVENEEIDGVYYDIFNYEEFNQKINRFFDCELEKKGNNEWLFQDNNYYHPSLGTGYMLNTVTQVDRIFDNGDGSFLVEGLVYRFESSMDSNIYEQYLQPKSTWSASMESELIGTVTTTIVYSYKLNHYVLEDYQANYYPSNEWVASESINNGLLLYSYKNEYINKLNSVEEGMSDLDYLYENGITVELIEAEETKLKRWDDMLNEIYSLLKIQLTESEMKELKSKQLSWIEYRDTTANNEASEEGGGSLSTVVYYSSLARLTKERCYELVNTYME